MTCIEFRRQRLSGSPLTGGADERHAMACAGCAEFNRSVVLMDADVDVAARVSVPTELVDRILLDRCLQSRRGFFRIAVAASIVTATASGLIGLRLSLGGTDVAGMAIDYVIASTHELAMEVNRVPFEEVAHAFMAWGGHLRGPIGEVLLCKTCDIDSRSALHLLVNTSMGKVTMLLMPPYGVSARESTERAGYAAVVVPAGRGSLAIVADTNAAAVAMERTVRRQIVWS